MGKKVSAVATELKPDAVVYSHFEQSMLLPLGRIAACPWNKRVINPTAPKNVQMVETVKDVGVQTPVLARPHPDEKLCGEGWVQLVFGSRRVWSSHAAGRSVIPCVVRELSDEDARLATAIENLERDDLEPWEEAASIKEFASLGWDAEAIAKRLKRPAVWVARRMSLAELEQEWFEEWQKVPGAKGSCVIARFTMGHMEAVARMPAAVRAEVLRDWREEMGWLPSIEQFERDILSEYSHLLSVAPFDVKDDALVPGAGPCGECPKRSSCQRLLFQDMKDVVKEDRCLDAACWEQKVAATVATKEKALREKHGNSVVLLTRDHEKAEKGMVSEWQVVPTPKSKGGVPALHTDGPMAGKVEYVKPVKESSRAAGGVKEKSEPSTMAQRQEKLRRRRVFLRVAKMLEVIGGSGKGKAKKEALPAPELETVARLVAVFGTNGNQPWVERKHWTQFDAMKKPGEVAAALWESVWTVLQRRYTPSSGTDHKLMDTDAKRLADIFELDWEGLWAEACAEIPEPKSWGKSEGAEAELVPAGVGEVNE